MATQFPSSKLPVQPVYAPWRWSALAGAPRPEVEADQHRYLNSARVALAHAYRLAGVSAGDQVLIPALHCPAMTGPLHWLGAQPVFYPLGNGLGVDPAALKPLLGAQTKAIVAVHYFGFPAALNALRHFCAEHELRLIEDCAHSFWLAQHSRADYAVASSYKFFPGLDGGLLVSQRHSLQTVQPHSKGAIAELKAAWDAMELAAQAGQLNWFRPLLRLKQQLRDRPAFSQVVPQAGNHESSAHMSMAAAGGDEFEPQWLDSAMSVASRLAMQLSDHQAIQRQRQHNYDYLHQRLASLPGVSPLFAQRPTDVVPQVYPLRVEAVNRVFPALKHQGVPIVRFGEQLDAALAADLCPLTNDLSSHLLQFPIHQSLSEVDLCWMADRIEEQLTCV